MWPFKKKPKLEPIQGPAGGIGLAGTRGERGERGPAGPAGPIGPVGQAGPCGADGVSGRRGEPGTTGKRGERGDRGAIVPLIDTETLDVGTLIDVSVTTKAMCPVEGRAAQIKFVVDCVSGDRIHRFSRYINADEPDLITGIVEEIRAAAPDQGLTLSPRSLRRLRAALEKAHSFN